MRKDAFIKHTGYLTVFYIIGIAIFTLLYQNEIVSVFISASILLLMALISLLLAVYYMKQTICEDCKAVYTTMLILISFMLVTLISTTVMILTN